MSVAPTWLNGPYGQGFDGRLDLGGFSAQIQAGRVQFPGSNTAIAFGLRGAGLNPAQVLVLATLNTQDKTVTWAISGNTITFTRDDTTANAEMDFLILFLA